VFYSAWVIFLALVLSALSSSSICNYFCHRESVRRILNYNTFAFVALLIWLLASWSGAHGHLCFDGQEPPVSIHMDMMGDHPEHDSAEKHVDADVELGQFALAKLIKIDLPLLIAIAFLVAVLFEQLAVFVSRQGQIFSSRLVGLRPPLRAPPTLPA
jgi:hypothetical protein